MDANRYQIAALQRGETIQIRPRGNSMRPKVNNGALVTVAPCDPATLNKGDIVLVRVGRQVYLHLVKAIAVEGKKSAPSQSGYSEQELREEPVATVGAPSAKELPLEQYGRRFLIGNNHGHVNGWVSANSIYGIAIAIE